MNAEAVAQITENCNQQDFDGNGFIDQANELAILILGTLSQRVLLRPLRSSF